MNNIFTKCILDKSVVVCDEYLLSSDQAFYSYPCRFATVNLTLESSPFLCMLANRIRRNFSQYNFYIGLNDYNESNVDSCIVFEVIDCEADDYGELYVIDLSFEEQKAMYCRLDRECERNYGKSCKELLEEARKELL